MNRQIADISCLARQIKSEIRHLSRVINRVQIPKENDMDEKSQKIKEIYRLSYSADGMAELFEEAMDNMEVMAALANFRRCCDMNPNTYPSWVHRLDRALYMAASKLADRPLIGE